MIMIYVKVAWTKESELNLANLTIKLHEDMPMVSSGIWGLKLSLQIHIVI